MKKNRNSQTTSGQKTKPTKARGPVQRDSKEVMAELVAKLSERLEQEPAQENAAEGKPQGTPAPNRDRLTVGVDLGDQWSNTGSKVTEVHSRLREVRPTIPLVLHGCQPPNPPGGYDMTGTAH